MAQEDDDRLTRILQTVARRQRAEDERLSAQHEMEAARAKQRAAAQPKIEALLRQMPISAEAVNRELDGSGLELTVKCERLPSSGAKVSISARNARKRSRPECVELTITEMGYVSDFDLLDDGTNARVAVEAVDHEALRRSYLKLLEKSLSAWS